MRKKILEELKKVELKRIEMDMYGSTIEEYLKVCEKEKELREKIYNVDYRDITKEEIRDFIREGY